ncbi:MAG: hypothetical protein U5K84_14770 [Alkalibacterium sp.]|nr:hypothetical protein [Alkalibacterium sp.]
MLFAVIYGALYWINIQDAKVEAQKIRDGWKPGGVIENFKNSWDTAFPYVLIGPGFLLLDFCGYTATAVYGLFSLYKL